MRREIVEHMVKLERDKSVDSFAFHRRLIVSRALFIRFQMLLFVIFVVIFICSIDSCPLTDNYLSRCHCGILTNGESYIKCDEKSLDHVPIFKRSFPYDELILRHNRIVNLTRTSFDHIKTIRRIDLEKNSLSSIDPDLLRLLGNYLEELILTGDDYLNDLQFLTRYPLKKLRVLKLDHFNLSGISLEKTFLNMSKLEFVQLRSCQLTTLPNFPQIQRLDLEENFLPSSIQLSSSYVHLNLAQNPLVSIVLQNNPQLISLNLSKNRLTEFVAFPMLNENLKDLDLSENFLSFLDFSMFNENLIQLNLDSNRFQSIHFEDLPSRLRILSLKKNLIKQLRFSKKKINSSLTSLDLSENQLKTIEKNFLFEQLTSLDLRANPLQCNCHLNWLNQLVRLKSMVNASIWTCLLDDSHRLPFLSADFQCLTVKIPRIIHFNITYAQISSHKGLLIQWTIDDPLQTLDFLQISISQPFYLSSKLPPNQSQLFLTNQIQSNRQYHLCLLLFHRYARDKYCREIVTDKLILLRSNDDEQQLVDTNNSHQEQRSTPSNVTLQLMLIGSAIGGLLTFILIFTCCYLCVQLEKLRREKSPPIPPAAAAASTLYQHSHAPYYPTNRTLHYPMYHSHSTTCPYHQENISNSTDSSQIDSSLSTSTSNPTKHIYQTIDNRDYSTLQRQTELFDLWNKSLKHKR